MKEWIHLTSDEINQLDRTLPVIIPLGLIESHGPHLAVSVDIDSAQYFAGRLLKQPGLYLRLLSIMALPMRWRICGYAWYYRQNIYPGDIRYMQGLCKKGFLKVIFITGHGANKTPCELAFYEVWEQYPGFKGACWNWWSDCDIKGIHHADKGETEVALALGTIAYMDRVKDFTVSKPWYKIRSRFELDAESGGINGMPSEADIENGKAYD
jgi:creatinine amidohydrolase